jgi:hypothetical protein
VSRLATRCSSTVRGLEGVYGALMPVILSSDARRSRPRAPFGLCFRCSNTRVCSAPVLDQASPATGLDGRASPKGLAMYVHYIGLWGLVVTLVCGCSGDSPGAAAPLGDAGPTPDGSSGSAGAGGSGGGNAGAGGSGGTNTGGTTATGGARVSTGGVVGTGGSSGTGGAPARCTQNGNCAQGQVCYTGLAQASANGYCVRRLTAPCDPTSGGCPCLEIAVKDDHSCEGVLGAYCTGTDDPTASWYCAVPP